MERFACAGVTRRPKDGARPVAFARSRSISLSPSPDKSEKKVVGIASNPYRVHQTEYIRRQYCTLVDRSSLYLVCGAAFNMSVT